MAKDNTRNDDSQSDAQPSAAGPSLTNSFTKGMTKDYNETFIGEGFYTHARNAVNVSHDGQVGTIGNEPSNLHCVDFPYSLIGTIYILNNEWVAFTTDDIDSEIGIFNELNCTYTKVVNAPCLNFKKSYLITGAYRERYDCQRLVYFDDGLNPTRVLDLDKVPYEKKQKIVKDCVVETETTNLNCEELRLASLMTYPCVTLKKGRGAGTLANGSYQVCIAYTVNQVRVSDYLAISEVQGLFTHENTSSSLEAIIETIDKDFDEFELVLLSNVNAQTTAKRIGFYSTNVSTIYIDRIDSEAINVNIADIVFRSEPIEKSDAMYTVGDYLLRVGIYSKFRFNYQLQANKIVTKWVAVKYPASYYVDGGNNATYMRDEQYSFFIRWVYNTGERSDSYHIPGRKATAAETATNSTQDAFETLDGIRVKEWEVNNTAKSTATLSYTLADGGEVVMTGDMGYWESVEKYPDDKSEIWGDLCGKPIRHHKMPDETIDPALNLYSSTDDTITLLGVQFNNITHPLDLDGNPIESIIGYEILRGSREGNKTIVSKGIINNLREYTIPGTEDVGLYQNYPYNDLRPDDYLTSTEQLGNNGNSNKPKLSKYRKDVFSFHGPELMFSKPYLDANELKIYKEYYGTADGRFINPYKHPRSKIAGDGITVISSVLAGLNQIARIIGSFASAGASLIIQGTEGIPLTTDVLAKHRQDLVTGKTTTSTSAAPGAASATVTTAYDVNQTIAARKRQVQNKAITRVNGIIVTLLAPLTFKAQQQQLFTILYGFIPKRQYAAQYISHGFYNQFADVLEGNRRRKILTSRYVNQSVQSFNTDYQINNANRNAFVAVQIQADLSDPINKDDSRFTMQKSNYELNRSIKSNISSYYGAIKIPSPSQYGQLDSIKQQVISYCIEQTSPVKEFKYTSPVYFGGDVYLNRYTEKNSMLFFNTWLMGEPDTTEFDYTKYINVPYPRFWLNTEELHSEYINNAANYYSLDGLQKRTFYIQRGYFYLFNSGVRDFFVESEINLAYRDWTEEVSKHHYDPYGYSDLQSMFRSDSIQDGNYYRYDYSLSISKLFGSSISWGNILPRDYNPVTSQQCYTYRPTRVMYSLPIQYQSKKDNWRSFLTNNYTDFTSDITAIKSINMTGALFMMKSQSPLKFMGVEELKLDATGTKIRVGDGGLFTGDNQLQQIVNADVPFEYASCQNRYSTVGTKYGVFWVTQNQGKVFQYGGEGIGEISDSGMKWWLAKYLPSQLLKVFPDYPYYDNPVIGVGVQTIYDNTNEILYITKKDYKPIIDGLQYDASVDLFYTVDQTSTITYYSFKDKQAFEDASFTISYDPKLKAWISFHDWIPTFMLPTKNHFMTVNDSSTWKHNERCDSYCNFYGGEYPWEIEYVSSSGQNVTTTRSIEYMLEAYKYYNDCQDKFHILDRNFDEAIIYNSEQISGTLQLNIKPKNNPLELLKYPIVHTDYIDILYAKEENKYRFNQFWDVTNDRKEFYPLNLPAPTYIPMFITEANGYKFKINPDYIDYDKSPLERKKFRHYVNRVFLRRKLNGDVKFLFKMSNQKLQISYR